jgi:dihydrodipicolinate synthase/N-acetylneuraminate lyase
LNWSGVFPSIPTAFAPDGTIDTKAQAALVEFAVEKGAHGLVCFGLAGEVFQLTPEERRILTNVIVTTAAGRVPVLVGVSTESTYTTRELATHAERAGVDGVVVPPPTIAKLSRTALRDFYLDVAGAVSVPIMLQDAPGYIGNVLGLDLVANLVAEIPHLTHVKVEIDPAELAEWHSTLGDGVALFGGNGGLFTLDCVRMGAAGIAPGLDLVDLLVEIYTLETTGDSAAAESLFGEFLPMAMFELQTIDHYNACAKYVLSRRGVPIHPELRPPGLQLGPAAINLLEAYLRSLPIDGMGAGAYGVRRDVPGAGR